jgi:hypothetical protein
MLRNRGAALALAALCALAGYGAWVSPQQPPYHQTAGNRAENRRYEIRSQAPDERIAFYTEVLAWFTGVLAVVSAVVQGFCVNAGEKMHRRAGVKMHHGQRRRIVAGAWRSTGQGQPKLSLPVRSMNQLSVPTWHPPTTARSVGDGRSGATRSTASMASTGPSPQ